jgi:hypothetical protein
MLERAVAGMALKAIARITLGEPPHKGIPLLFGQHTGGSNGGAMEITSHQSRLGLCPGAQGKHPIHDQQTRHPR